MSHQSSTMLYLLLVFLLRCSKTVSIYDWNNDEVEYNKFYDYENRSPDHHHRHLQSNNQQQQSPYYVGTNFGQRNNYDVTLGNPLRGLASDPNLDDAYKRSSIQFSLEVFYFPFSRVNTGPGIYNWTDFDIVLNKIAARNNHAIPRFYIHYPGDPLALPPYLINSVQILDYSDFGGGKSPNYDDPKMKDAMKSFINELANKYDGDRRIAMIQAGLLGFWGEWHVMSNTFLPDSVKLQTLQWFDDAFSKTPIQTRYPRKEAYARNFGYYDDSFTWYTLDGVYNGNNKPSDFFFVPVLREFNITDFWKKAPMGGEVRPENVKSVFESSYVSGKKNQQDFYACSQITHSTYSKVGGVIGDYAGTSQSESNKANWNSARMGYSYQIDSIAVRRSTDDPINKIDMDIELENNGIAPFYYPLGLVINCSGIGLPHRIMGVETIIDQYSSKTFNYRNIPATPECLREVTVTFSSVMLYPDRPIKFAQGDGTIRVQIPFPPSGPVQPVPLRPPTKTPTIPPQPVPVPTNPVPTPTTIAASSSNSGLDVVLVDPQTNKEYPITQSGMSINLADIGASELSLIAKPSITSNVRVEFTWKDTDTGSPRSKVENSGPFVMGGNVDTRYFAVPYLSTLGPKEVVVTVVSTSTGLILATRTVQFNIVNSNDIDFTFFLVDPATNRDISTLVSGTQIDLGKVGSNLALRAEL